MEENIKINCPSCGSPVPQEDARDGICTCPSCDSTFYIKDIISQPKITVNKTVINNHYGPERQSESLSQVAKDIATSYADAYKETAKVVFSPRVMIAGIISTILCIVFLIVGWFVYDAMLDRSLAEASAKTVNETDNSGPVDISKRIYIVLADGSSTVNGEASIAYYWYDDTDEFKDIQLHAEPNANLSNGDVVTISISDKGSHEDTVFEPETWTYTVNLMLMDKME